MPEQHEASNSSSQDSQPSTTQAAPRLNRSMPETIRLLLQGASREQRVAILSAHFPYRPFVPAAPVTAETSNVNPAPDQVVTAIVPYRPAADQIRLFTNFGEISSETRSSHSIHLRVIERLTELARQRVQDLLDAALEPFEPFRLACTHGELQAPQVLTCDDHPDGEYPFDECFYVDPGRGVHGVRVPVHALAPLSFLQALNRALESAPSTPPPEDVTNSQSNTNPRRP